MHHSSTSITEDPSPDLRSRSSNSNIKGLKVWDHELVRTDSPYYDKRFHIPFNIPPNEVNFLGGIGERKGHPRSKIHPNRPTIIQKIFNMRNQNRIATSFTQPPNELNCLVRRSRKKAGYQKQCTPKQVERYVKQVKLADFYPSSPSSDSDESLQLKILSKSQARSRRNIKSDDVDDEYTIDKKPLYYSKSNQIKIIENILNKSDSEALKESVISFLPKENSLGDVAKEVRSLYKNRNLIKVKTEKPVQISSSSSSGSISPTIRSSNSKKLLPLTRKVKKVSYQKLLKKHLSGYMYGPIIKQVKPDPLTHDQDKYGIPNTMKIRGKKERKKQKIQHDILRKVRLSHMGFTEPPKKEQSSSSDDESIRNIKRIALIRTPYFVMPTVKISQQRREKFRSPYLKKERLDRINQLFLSDRRKSQIIKLSEDNENKKDKKGAIHYDDLQNKESPTSFEDIVSQISKFKIKDQPDVTLLKPELKEFHQIISDKYEKQRKRIEPPTGKPNVRPTFQSFMEEMKNDLSFEDPPEKPTTQDSANVKDKKFSLEQNQKMYKRKKNDRINKYDDIVGPFYLDPTMVDKMQSPEKFKEQARYFTNLFRSQYWLRDRLCVNSCKYEEEKIGIQKKYFSRLATEWDEYYIHELRYRHPARKFCVKTDILNLREMARKKFNIYYIQENLIDLNAQILVDKKLVNDVFEFQKLCEDLFKKWKTNAFNEVIEKNSKLDSIYKNIRELKDDHISIVTKLDKINKDILIVERELDNLVIVQNYYFLLMKEEWRQVHDWIHIDENRLVTPQVGMKYCKTRNIRRKGYGQGKEVKEHFEKVIEPNLVRMQEIIPDAMIFNENLQHFKYTTLHILIDFNQTYWLFTKVESKYNSLMLAFEVFARDKKESIRIIESRHNFYEDRHKNIKEYTRDVLNKVLPKTVIHYIKTMALTDEFHRFIFDEEYKNIRFNLSSVEKFEQIHAHVMNLLEQLDDIPFVTLQACEQIARDEYRYQLLKSKKAVIQENRFEILGRQLWNQFSPIPSFKRLAACKFDKYKLSKSKI